jgi:long-chain acyl-CoA synthetase
MQHACAAISVTIATAYATLGESGLQHSLNEPGCVGIFTNDDLLPTVLKVLPYTPCVKYVIYDGAPSATLLEHLRQNGHIVLSQDEVRDLGRGKFSIEHLHPKSSDLSCIMYTSGTTGAPKGVMITHSMLVSAIASVQHLLGHHFQPDHDLFIAFLPLAHSFEYAVELALSFIGCPIAYGRVKTLTDTSVRNCVGDLKECSPTIMVGVPLIWEMIRKGILGQVEKMPAVAKGAFHAAVRVKMAGIPGLSAVADSLVLKKVKAQTGGRLRYVLSGSANLSTDTQKFMKAALVTILQGASLKDLNRTTFHLPLGYGLTESCGYVCSANSLRCA